MSSVTKNHTMVIGKYLPTISQAPTLRMYLTIQMMMSILSGHQTEDTLCIHARCLSTGPLIYVYDVQSKSFINLTQDGGGASLMPQWAPNGKVYFGYPHFWAKYRGTYTMNPDGTDRKKILDSTATVYFYQDSYTFLYISGARVYKTNIDGGFNEFVLDLEPTSDQFFTIRDFNPVAGELLVNTNTIPGSSSAIGEYNVETKRLKAIVVADTGYTLFLQKYSRDFSKVVFIEHSSNDEYLSVLGNGVKKRLVRIPASTPPVYFSYNPMQFSPDGRYVAFSKQVFQGGPWVSWIEYLYAVDVTSGAVQSIDEGFYPSWNPRP